MEEKSTGLKLGDKRNIHFLIAIAIIAIFWCLPALSPITDVGMRVIGVFIATLYLWMTVDILWSSIFCIVMLGFSGFDTMNTVLMKSIGNAVAVQVLFLFIYAGAMVHEGITDHIARWFLTRKVSEGKPWMLVFMICLGCFVISAFINPFTPIILFWPVVYDILREVGYTEKDKFSKILVILVVLASLAGFPVPPYMSNGLALLANFRTISDNAYVLNDGSYFVCAAVMGLLFIVISILISKYVFRPDTEKLKSLTIEQINQNQLTPLDTRQKVLGYSFVVFSIVMLVPSLFKTAPIMSFLYANSYGIAVFFVAVLAGLHIKGKPVIEMIPSIQKGVNWGTWFLIVAAIYIGSSLTDKSTGLTAFLSQTLGPVFNGMGVIMFLVILMIVLMVFTNICNSLVIGMILQPVILLYCQTNGMNPAPIVTLSIFFVLSCAMFTPAASPFAAMLFANKKWLTSNDVMKHAGVFILAELVMCIVIGYPLCMLLM